MYRIDVKAIQVSLVGEPTDSADVPELYTKDRLRALFVAEHFFSLSGVSSVRVRDAKNNTILYREKPRDKWEGVATPFSRRP